MWKWGLSVIFVWVLIFSSASGGDRFEIIRSDSAGVIRDKELGVLWEKNSPLKTMKWQEGLTYCESLNLGGSQSWRLPSYDELISIVDYENNTSSIATDEIFWDNMSRNYYWSGDAVSNKEKRSWAVAMVQGNSHYYHQGFSINVKCVTGKSENSPYMRDRSRLKAKLEWQDTPSNETLTLSQPDAIKHCEKLTLNNKDDWRLPSLKELQTLSERDNFRPATPKSIKYSAPEKYWTSTGKSRSEVPGHAFLVYFDYGDTGTWFGGKKLHFRCVRGDEQAP
ncbi:MAG: DUF1566 domain-containing protein [Campylobacterota bacterium]|nr:DUF1566 domain-containing protein [Campylobacterota bacterium]